MSLPRDDRVYKFVASYVQRVWGTKRALAFPGSQPVSIERKHFPLLARDGAYVVCEKTDGERVLLVSFMFLNRRKTVLINRAFDMTTVNLNMSPLAYKGTMLEAELFSRGDGGGEIMVFDGITANGEIIGHLPWIDRYERIEGVVKACVSMTMDKHALKLKQFFPMIDFGEFVDEYLPSVTQKTDGLIFTPVEEPVRVGTHETCFKWKPTHMNTVDFALRRRGDAWRLYAQERGKPVFVDVVADAGEAWWRDGAIVECQFVDERWVPLKERTDKTHANNRRTFFRTLVNLKENIDINEFRGLICK
jgi:hypothetical protein